MYVELIPIFAGQYAISIPLMLVWIVGGIVALLRLSEQRLASRLVLGAIGGSMVLRLVVGPLTSALPLIATRQGYDITTVGGVMAIGAVLTAIGNAICWGLLLAAVFVRE